MTDEIGLVSLSLHGERNEIKCAIEWLEELGVKVEPVEIQTIGGWSGLIIHSRRVTPRECC